MSLQLYADFLAKFVEDHSGTDLEIAKDILGGYFDFFDSYPEETSVTTFDSKWLVTSGWAFDGQVPDVYASVYASSEEPLDLSIPF